MRKSMRGALFGALLVALIVTAGCSSGDDFPLVIDAQYVWTIGSFGCPILVGILTTQQTFTVNQNGTDVTWGFTDTNGSQVTFTGTYEVDRLTGVLDVLDVGNRSIQARITMVAKLVNGLLTLDGEVSVIFDSDGICGGSWAGAWMIETGVPGVIQGTIVFLGENGDPSDSITVLDLDSMTVITTIETSIDGTRDWGGYRVELSPDGNTLYSTPGDARPAGDRLFVLDANNFTRITSFDVAPTETDYPVELEALCISPDGSKIYTFDERGDGCIFVIDAATLRVIDAGCYLGPSGFIDNFGFPVDEPEECVVDPSGDFVYMVDNTSAIKVDVRPMIDGQANPNYLGFDGEIAVASGGHGIAFAGTKVYVDSHPGISVVDPTTMSLLTFIDCPEGYHIEASRDGNTIFAVDEGIQLTVIDVATDTFQVVQLSMGSARGICTTPDDRRILIATSSGLIVLDRQSLVELKTMPGSWRSVTAKAGTFTPPPVTFATLIAFSNNGDLYEVNESTGESFFCLDTRFEVSGVQSLGKISSAIYNTETNQLWLGAGGSNALDAIEGRILILDPSGLATLHSPPQSETDGIPGMAQQLSGGPIYVVEGDDDHLLVVDPITGALRQFGGTTIDDDDFSGIESDTIGGNGMTFVGETLYLAADDGPGTHMLFTIDYKATPPAPPLATALGSLALVGFPAGTDTDFAISALATHPDNRIFGILKDRELKRTFLCTINPNPVDGMVVVTNVGQNSVQLDGLAFIPEDLITCLSDD